jgi:hypothetical protein
MSLIVAAADAEVSAGLMGRVSEIEAGAVACGDLASVLESCGYPSGPDCVICADLSWARRIADASPNLPVVLATQRLPDSELLLCALRSGLADVWTLPMAAGDMRERLQAIRARAAANAGGGRLNRYGAELERDMLAGRHVQMGMLPQSPLRIGRYLLQYHNVPSMMMSGDFVDYFPLDSRHFLFYLADVAGHGASAAFVTVLLKSFSRRLRREHRPDMLDDPGRILEWVNAELLEQKIDKHVTVLLGICDLETDEVFLVNGGHYPPAIRVSAEGPEIVQQKGKPVGLFDEVTYQVKQLKMEPGERLVLFSDGVIDAMGSGGLADKEGSLLAAAAVGGDVAEVWARLPVSRAGLREPDDMTCLLVLRES